MTKIEWTNKTWNPITGCSKISAGCLNCFAEKMAKRLAGRYGYSADEPFRPGTIHQDKFNEPLQWQKPYMVFVCSMADLFHPAVPNEIIDTVLNVCREAEHHTFQILTKRAERLVEGFAFPDNVWVGITAENQQTWNLRTPFLKQVQAGVRFVSCEPLLSDLEMGQIDWLDWAIVGAESGTNVRPMDENWVRHIRNQCQETSVPFFYKQRIVNRKKISTPLLDGRVWNEYPQVALAN